MQFAAAINSGDTAWVLGTAALGLMLTLPGLALYHGGRVRAASFADVAAQGLAIAAAVSLTWVTIGYSLGFGEGSAFLGGMDNLMLGGLADILTPFALPESAFAALQTSFAILAAVLIAGALAERARFGWVLGLATVWSVIVYAPVARWLWGGGWLAELGALDFAGGLVVHASAGVSALVAAWMLGTRHDPSPVPGNPALALAGAGLLWAGWFSLNGGSAFAANDAAALAMLNTLVAAAAGALTWMGIERLRHRVATPLSIATGSIAGLATISPAAGFVGVGGAIALGFVGALLGSFAVSLVKQALKIDDALDVFAVHGVGGIAGALLLPLLISEKLGGAGFPEGATFAGQAIAQMLAVGAVVLWSAIGTLIAGYMVAIVVPMRAAEPTA